MATRAKDATVATIEGQVLETVRELLAELGSHPPARNVTLLSSFERDLGLGSLERVELLMRCEARFDARLPDEVAQRADTPGEWVQALLEVARGHTAETAKNRYWIQQPAREAPPAPVSATNWVEVLRRHADLEHDRVHIHLAEEDAAVYDISYGELLCRASEVAAGLRASGLLPDETVAIMLPTCAEFFYAFFGVMLAGGVAVPIYPPARRDKVEEYVRRQVMILRNAGVRFLISFERVKAVSRIMQLSIPSLVDVVTVDVLRQAGLGAGTKVTTASAEPSNTAFIQYTSGSTGEPKGVVLSQGNVLANVRGIGWAVRFRPDDIVVTWLPLYHDMGLIGSWLFSVYFGAPITILSPLAFLTRPERWLWALHDSKGTLCPAPNFSYELCARKIADTAIRGLDLSTWRVAINAGEAVLPDTLARFAKRFEPYGFRPESYVPCYGLAESSVALTFPPINRRPVIDTIRRHVFEAEGKAVPGRPDAPDSEVLRFVANGVPLPGHEVRIADDQGREADERVQGRVLFRGLSRTAGYYRSPKATAAAIDEDGWMDSGDLGYWADGELFITGRLKDCIVKAGRNIIPHEAEAAAARVRGVRKGCVAAFGVVDADTGTERLVLVAEVRATNRAECERIEAEVSKSVDAILGIPPDTVVLVPPQSIPKTSSGKLRRHDTRNLYLSGGLNGESPPPWLQVLRLWKENVGTWAGLRIAAAGASAHRTYAAGLLFVTTTLTGALVPFAPDRKTAGRVVRAAARALLRLTGENVIVQSADLVPSSGNRPMGSEPEVLFANRAGHHDPLVLAATLPSSFLIADRSALASLPSKMRALLDPLVVPPLNGDAAPRGGTLRERIRRALEAGHSVLVLPDGPPGAPASLSRFRLDALHAALETASSLRVVGVLGTCGILQQSKGRKLATGNSRLGNEPAVVRLGEPFFAEVRDHSNVAALRERVRKALAELCRDTATAGAESELKGS